MLLLAKQNLVLEEKSYKRDMIWFFGSGNSKIIFALLIEVVVLQMGFSLVDIREFSFQGSFSLAFKQCHRCGGPSL